MNNDSLLPDGWKVQIEVESTDTSGEEKNDNLLPNGWKVQIGVESPNTAREEDDDNMLPDGWKLQVEDEDLHHLERVVETLPRTVTENEGARSANEICRGEKKSESGGENKKSEPINGQRG